MKDKEVAGICKMIGCSGMSPKNCPGDPLCKIILKIIKYPITHTRR